MLKSVLLSIKTWAITTLKSDFDGVIPPRDDIKTIFYHLSNRSEILANHAAQFETDPKRILLIKLDTKLDFWLWYFLEDYDKAPVGTPERPSCVYPMIEKYTMPLAYAATLFTIINAAWYTIILNLGHIFFNWPSIGTTATLIAKNVHFSLYSVVMVLCLTALLNLLNSAQTNTNKVKVLVCQLLILATTLLISKAEQYVPIYLLVEFGTCIYIVMVVSQSNQSSKQGSVRLLLILLIIIIAGVLCKNQGSYWVTNFNTYLSSQTAPGDFSSLKLTTLVHLLNVVVPMLVFIMAITVILINVAGTLRSPSPKRTSSWLSSHFAKKTTAHNANSDYTQKNTNSNVLKVNN